MKVALAFCFMFVIVMITTDAQQCTQTRERRCLNTDPADCVGQQLWDSRPCDCLTEYALIDGNNYNVEDDALTASTSWPSCLTAYSRLRPCTPGVCCAWATAAAQTGDWLQVDLGATFLITKVATRGRSDDAYERITQYKLGFSLDETTFTYTEVLPGNTDQTTVVENDIPEYPVARYVRIEVVDFNDWPAVAWELYGCPANP